MVDDEYDEFVGGGNFVVGSSSSKVTFSSEEYGDEEVDVGGSSSSKSTLSSEVGGDGDVGVLRVRLRRCWRYAGGRRCSTIVSVGGGGGSSSSKVAFSPEVHVDEDVDGVVDEGGSSSSKVAFSFDGSGGDGMMLSKLDGGGSSSSQSTFSLEVGDDGGG